MAKSSLLILCASRDFRKQPLPSTSSRSRALLTYEALFHDTEGNMIELRSRNNIFNPPTNPFHGGESASKQRVEPGLKTGHLQRQASAKLRPGVQSTTNVDTKKKGFKQAVLRDSRTRTNKDIKSRFGKTTRHTKPLLPSDPKQTKHHKTQRASPAPNPKRLRRSSPSPRHRNTGASAQ